MDFQRLFKRKQEGSASPFATGDGGDALNDREIIIREGELFDGSSPAPVDWSKVGGAITVKAGNILGILEGRTRIKAGALEEVHPGSFAKLLNSEAELSIPLHVVVMQIQDVFCGLPSADARLDRLETPFAELAREDEVRFNKVHGDQPVVRQNAEPESLDVPPLAEAASKEGGKDEDLFRVTAPLHTEASPEFKSHLRGSEQPSSVIERLGPAPEYGNRFSKFSSPARAARHDRSHSPHRAGHERLQELYLTDEPLDGSKISELVLQLPRVSGVVVLWSDGAVLGGELGGGISDKLLSLTPDFVTQVSRFSENLPGGPTKFITFFANALQISLVIGGDIRMLIGHEGKYLPPGLRERLIATAEALNIMYGPQP